MWAAPGIDPDVEFVDIGIPSTETVVAGLRTRALKSPAEAGKPLTLGTLRSELEGPQTSERQPRTVDDPGASDRPQ